MTINPVLIIKHQHFYWQKMANRSSLYHLNPFYLAIHHKCKQDNCSLLSPFKWAIWNAKTSSILLLLSELLCDCTAAAFSSAKVVYINSSRKTIHIASSETCKMDFDIEGMQLSMFIFQYLGTSQKTEPEPIACPAWSWLMWPSKASFREKERRQRWQR